MFLQKILNIVKIYKDKTDSMKNVSRNNIKNLKKK